MSRDIAKLMERIDRLERRMANSPVPPAGSGIGITDAFIGKVVAWDYDLVNVQPMVFGDPNDWDTAVFETEERCGVWAGVGTLTPPGTVVACLKFANASRPVAIPIYNLVGDFVVGPEFKACEPAAADLADPDTSSCPLPAFTDINCPGQ